jgi:hypothetical protein
MKKIPLTRGQVALVDDADYESLMQWKWYASLSRKTNTYYAKRGVYLGKIDGKHKCTTTSMHKTITGFKMTDHKNHDTLDNRRRNLRESNNSLNQANKSIQKDNKCGFKGVHEKTPGYWVAQIRVRGINYHIGCYRCPRKAHKAYMKEAKHYFGPFAYKG